MLIGYIRVSKRDGSQVLDLQRDALAEAGVDASRSTKTWPLVVRMTDRG